MLLGLARDTWRRHSTFLSRQGKCHSTAVDCMPPSSRANVETAYPSHGILNCGAHFSRQNGLATKTLCEIAILIVLIKRPAVAPNLEQSDTDDLRLWTFSSYRCRSMGPTGEVEPLKGREGMHIVS